MKSWIFSPSSNLQQPPLLTCRLLSFLMSLKTSIFCHNQVYQCFSLGSVPAPFLLPACLAQVFLRDLLFPLTCSGQTSQTQYTMMIHTDRFLMGDFFRHKEWEFRAAVLNQWQSLSYYFPWAKSKEKSSQCIVLEKSLMFLKNLFLMWLELNIETQINTHHNSQMHNFYK